MAERPEELAARPGHLSLISATHIVEQEDQPVSGLLAPRGHAPRSNLQDPCGNS